VFDRLNDKASPVPYEVLDELPPSAQSNYSLRTLLTGQPQGPATLPYQALEAGPFLSFLEAKQLMVLSGKKDYKYSQHLALAEEGAGLPERRVLVVAGGYGSGKTRLAESLLRNHPGLTLFTVGHHLTEPMAKASYLERLLQHVARDPASLTVAVLPAWIPARETLDELAEKAQIVNVVCKVSVCCFYKDSSHGLTPQAFAGLPPGYSQYILVDSFNEPDSEVSALSAVLAKAFPEGRIIRTTNNVVHAEVTAEMVQRPRFAAPAQAALRLKCSPFMAVRHEPEIVFLPFLLPVLSSRLRKEFHKKVMGMHRGVVLDRQAVLRGLEQYRLEAEASKDPLTLGLFQLRVRIALAKAEARSPQILYCKLWRPDQLPPQARVPGGRDLRGHLLRDGHHGAAGEGGKDEPGGGAALLQGEGAAAGHAGGGAQPGPAAGHPRAAAPADPA
jgi:hypothetical protein